MPWRNKQVVLPGELAETTPPSSGLATSAVCEKATKLCATYRHSFLLLVAALAPDGDVASPTPERASDTDVLFDLQLRLPPGLPIMFATDLAEATDTIGAMRVRASCPGQLRCLVGNHCL